MILPVLLAQVAARWAHRQPPVNGWTPNESETEMSETITDFEEALDAWGMVTDANGRTWTRDENECARRWVHGPFWSRPDAAHQPAPPFTNGYLQEATA